MSPAGAAAHRAPSAPCQLDDRLARYDRPLLVDPAAQASLRRSGFHVYGPLLDVSQVARLRTIADEFLERLDEPWGDAFLTVGRVQDAALRADTTARAGEVVLPALRALFIDDARLRGSALQIKPPSPTSELNCHQDSSLVDERNWLGVYAWVALHDSGPRNGGLHVLPGSHRLGCWQRTLNVPWQLARFGEVMADLSVPLEVPAGSLVLFDAATVHSSPPNRTDRMRLAVNSFVTHADAPMLHFFRDDRTTPGRVEAYEIDDSFFSDDDIMVRPGPQHRYLGEWDQHVIEWTPDEFERLCRQAIEEAA